MVSYHRFPGYWAISTDVSQVPHTECVTVVPSSQWRSTDLGKAEPFLGLRNARTIADLTGSQAIHPGSHR